MKYEVTVTFRRDYQRLSPHERELFARAVARINDAYARRGEQPLPTWPASLRVRDLERRPGYFEMTWSFAGPDGRALFDYVTIDGEVAIRWQRIGDHRIFREP